jgi:hypothetical protein
VWGLQREFERRSGNRGAFAARSSWQLDGPGLPKLRRAFVYEVAADRALHRGAVDLIQESHCFPRGSAELFMTVRFVRLSTAAKPENDISVGLSLI